MIKSLVKIHKITNDMSMICQGIRKSVKYEIINVKVLNLWSAAFSIHIDINLVNNFEQENYVTYGKQFFP